MKKHPKLGVVLFWLTWPLLWLYLRWSKRTRLLLVCGDEFLVVRSWLGPGAYGLPGGGLHKGEAPIDGLIREVREEIGITITPSEVDHLYNTVSHSQGFKFQYDCYLLRLSAKPGLVLQPSEITDAQWQPLTGPTLPVENDVTRAVAWWQNKK